MALKILCLLPILLLSLSDIRCQDNGDLLNNLLREAHNFEDLNADFELSKTKLLLKNKRDEYGGREGSSSFNSMGDTSVVDDPESWTGRWLPEKVIPKHRVVSKRLNDTDHQPHDIKLMTSTINSNCDDGKTNLTVDWSGSHMNHTCFRRAFIEPDVNAAAFIMHDNIPKAYHARHLCMKDKIEYNTYLPTFGPHRPAWARYGEYVFLPVQRWLHNLEHGAIIMLYHPCAHPLLVNKLRSIVTSCLYRHIITPYTLLRNERPLAIVSWGWAMTMSDVDQHLIEQFIKEHALHGSEMLSKDGDYDHLLKKPAEIITNVDDEIICPNSIQQHM